MTFVFASALLAVLRAEPGAERIEPRLEGAGISAVNLSKVVASGSTMICPRRRSAMPSGGST